MTARPFTLPLEAGDAVAVYITDGAAHDVVTAVLDGRVVLMAFEVDAAEHERRGQRPYGAVRSRGLLHALWALPEGIAWPVSGLSRLDADTLKDEGDGFVTWIDESVVRLYRPAGHVWAVGLASKRLIDAVATASQFPPIFRRYAVAAKATRSDPDAIAAARTVGVGVAVTGPDGLNVVGRAEPARTGVPGIYRWWLAEMAYRSWLQTNAH
jgi:hypothetical protein